jgi:hypothetical protein
LVREVGIRLDIVRSWNMLRDGESMGAMGEAALVTVVAQHPGLTMLAIAIAKDTVRTTCIELERNQRSRAIAVNFTHHGGLALLFGKRLRSKANSVHSGDSVGWNVRRELGFLGFTTHLAHSGREARRRRNGFRSTCLTLVLALALGLACGRARARALTFGWASRLLGLLLLPCLFALLVIGLSGGRRD